MFAKQKKHGLFVVILFIKYVSYLHVFSLYFVQLKCLHYAVQSHSGYIVSMCPVADFSIAGSALTGSP